MPDAVPPDFGRGLFTWDGLPVSGEPPHGAAVHVWRERDGRREWLLLHRRNAGSADGDWAWTPPSGARLPGEAIDECARRELWEETGLELAPVATGIGEEWALYVAEAPADVEITLDAEHDAFEWLPPDAAVGRCRPAVVGAGIARAAEWLERKRG